MVPSSIKIALWLVASTLVSCCDLYSVVLMYVLYDDVFFRSHSWHALFTFTKFTDQYCHLLNSTGALLILRNTAIQVVCCHYMLVPFEECLW